MYILPIYNNTINKVMNNNKDQGSIPIPNTHAPTSAPAFHKQELPITSLGEIDWRFLEL
jgi:hypothetical protein